MTKSMVFIGKFCPQHFLSATGKKRGHPTPTNQNCLLTPPPPLPAVLAALNGNQSRASAVLIPPPIVNVDQ